MTQGTPLFLQDGDFTYAAEDFRSFMDSLFTEGVLDVPGGQLLVSPLGDGTMRVSVAPGKAAVKGDDTTGQGLYVVRTTAAETLPVTAAPGTGSRLDLLVYEVIDNAYVALGGRPKGSRLRVIQGTSTTGTPVAPSMPNTAIALASILVAAGQTGIVAGNLTDLRAQSSQATIGFARWDVQIFTTSGTWTKPAGAVRVWLDVIGGGGGGGGGVNSSDTTSIQIYGGGGGGGGARCVEQLSAALLPSTVSVTVGSGGIGATALGQAGADGGDSRFGSYGVGGRGLGALGGNTSATNNAGAGGWVNGAGTQSAALGTSLAADALPLGAVGPFGGRVGSTVQHAEFGGAAGGQGSGLGGRSMKGGGGGGSGGAMKNGVTSPGGVGGLSGTFSAHPDTVAAGTAGSSTAVAGSGANGFASTTTGVGHGGGGGGGTNAGGRGGNGGNGGLPGGGGGGAGQSFATAAPIPTGGNGGRGEVRVFTLCNV